MAQFDESKVINTLHLEKAEVGKKYWYADDVTKLKYYVEQDRRDKSGELKYIDREYSLFEIIPDSNYGGYWYLLYPYEEPSKKRMTNRQLAEWLAKGNGQYTTGGTIYHRLGYSCNNEDAQILKECYKIRSWGSEEWIEPTVDIYERDCKGVTK